MCCWAGGQSLSCPPLPVITSFGTAPYHAVCDFAPRCQELCVTSMRPKVYLPVCVFDDATHVQLPAPDSKCDCICGEECSHRFAADDLFHGFLQMLPDATTYEEILDYMSPSVAVIMSEPIPIDHIFSYESDRWQDLKSMDYADVVGVKGKRSKRFKRRRGVQRRRLITVHHMANNGTATQGETTQTDQVATQSHDSTSVDPSTIVGKFVKVLWAVDNTWYRAKVTNYDEETGESTLEYEVDESEEVVDLREVQWVLVEAQQTITAQPDAAAQQTTTRHGQRTGPHSYTCSYGQDCLYPGGLKYRSHLCDKCDVRSHAMCSHELGHTGDKVLCKKRHAVEEHVHTLKVRTGRQLPRIHTHVWWSHVNTHAGEESTNRYV